MKNYINISSILLGALLVFSSCQEDQDVAPIQSTADYPIASFTLSGGSTTFNEKSEPVFVYDIVLDKPLLRNVDISAIQVGGTATLHEDYDIVNATILPYTTTGQITIMIHSDAVVEGTETLDLEIITGPSLANKFLLNPSSELPTLSLEINDYVFCGFTVDSRDTYGDGWNGASIRLETQGVTTDYATDGPQTIFIVPIDEGADYSFTYVSGGGTGGAPGWESENYYIITGPDGTTWEGGSEDYSGIPTVGLITSGTCN
jgi:hypothetical protein